MSVLEQLPLEITTEILSHLPCADLLKLSRLSHYMHNVSRPLLFKNPILTSVKGETQSSLQIFLKVILSPGGETLASYVRSLHVQWASRHNSGSDISLLREAASRLELHLPLTWQDGQLVLLLHLLPHLLNLDLSPSGEGDDKFIQFLYAQTPTMPGTTLPLGLRHLRRFRCARDYALEGVSPSILLTVLAMPCMREIDIRLVDTDTVALHKFEAAASSSAVTHLRLVGIEPPAQFLTYILTVPTALTHFTYSPHGTRGDFHLARFGEALQPLKHSLQLLHLDLYGLCKPLNKPADGWIGSLSEWAALHTVRGSMMAFLGRGQSTNTPALADMLPAGIQEFEILRDAYWSLAEEKNKLLELELVMLKSARVPRLRKLAADLGGRAALRCLASLIGGCEDAGVVLVDSSAYRDTSRTQWRRRRPRTRTTHCRCG